MSWINCAAALVVALAGCLGILVVVGAALAASQQSDTLNED